MTHARILIVEDEIMLAKELARDLRRSGYDVVARVTTGEEAVRKAEETPPDLILMDIKLAGEMDGIEASALISARLDAAIIYLTAHTAADVFERAKLTEPHAYLTKPISPQELGRTVEMALYKQQMDKKLRESEEKLIEAARIAKLGHYSFDVESGLWTNSAELDDIFGIDVTYERTVDGWLQIVHPQFREIMAAYLQDHVLTQHNKFNKEYKIVDPKTGREKWVHGFGSLKFDDNHNPVEMFGTIQDVTDRKKTEEALAVERERLAVTLRCIGDGVISTDTEGRVLSLNEVAEQLTGWNEQEVLGRQIEQVFHIINEQTRQRCESPVEKVLQTGRVVGLANHTVLVGKDGTERILADSGAPITDKDGNTIGVVLVFRDVTQERLAEKALKENEEQKRAILDGISSHIAFVNENLEILWLNEQAYGSVGKTPGDMIGHKCHEFWADPEKPCDGCPTVRAFETKKSEHAEVVTPDGKVWDERGEPVFDPDGNLIGVVKIADDITHRKRIEQDLVLAVDELTRTNSEIRAFLTCSQGILDCKEFSQAARLIFDECCKVTGATSGYVALLSEDGSENEVIFLESGGLPCPVDPDLPMPIRGLRGEAYREGNVVYENDFPSSPWMEFMPEGHVILDNVLFAPLKLEGKPVGVLGIANKPGGFDDRDVRLAGAFGELAALGLSRTRAMEALQHSEERYRFLVDRAPIGIIPVDNTGWIHEVNEKLLEILGSPSAEATRSINMFTFPPLVEAGVSDVFKRCIEEGQPQTVEIPYKSNWGKTSLLRIVTTPIRDQEAGVSGCLATVEDFTARKRAEDAVKESVSLLSSTLEATADGILAVNQDGRITASNKRFQEMWGIPDHVIESGDHAKTFDYVLDDLKEPEEFLKRVRQLSSQPGVESFDIIEFRDGRVFERLSRPQKRDGQIVGRVSSFRDVSQQRLIQRQLLQAQKLEAVGTLAGGIAHDFNNLLQVILGYTDALLFDKKPGRPGYDELQAIRQSAKDGADLVKRILAFSTRQESKTRPVKLTNELKRMKRTLTRVIPKMIKVELNLEKDLKMIEADPSQMEQMLLNLAVNAHHAMPDGGGLTIETANVTLDKEYCSNHAGVDPGDYVLLSVSDTGLGMEKEVHEHIFEPFFTTKGPTGGTGLGLAMVYGIVKSHRGHIGCYSEPGIGTTFKIYLPAIAGRQEPDADLTREMPAFGSETILLVDDEERVRKLGEMMLTQFGYSVLTARNGTEALEAYSRRKNEISLVVLDLIMPEMGGSQCLAELLKIDPNVKVLIASGYAANGPTKDVLKIGALGLFAKPFEAKEFLRTVRKALDD